MQDLIWQLRDVDSFTVYVTAVFVAIVFFFIREIVKAPLLALFCVPFLMAGGILAPLVFQQLMITLAYDKDSNVAAMSATGVLTTLVALIVVKWVWTVLKERRVSGAKPVAATKRSPRKF